MPKNVSREELSIKSLMEHRVQEQSELHTECRLRSGFADEERHPAKQKPRRAPVRLAHKDVLAPRARHHRGQLGITESTCERKQSRHHVNSQNPSRRADVAG